MPDHTTTSAAQYLAEHGYTVGRGKIGGRGAPSADTIKHWCARGRIKARKVGWVWLIDEKVLDELIKKSSINNILTNLEDTHQDTKAGQRATKEEPGKENRAL